MESNQLAPHLESIVTYLVALSGAGAIGGRALAGWFLRSYRDPVVRSFKDPEERERDDDFLSFQLWWASMAGGTLGLVGAVLALAIDLS